MVTRGTPRQIKGVNFDTLKEEIINLHHNIGYFIGEVDYVNDLNQLSPKIGNVAFVKFEKKWFYWNGVEWSATSGGGGSGSGMNEQLIHQITKLDLNGLSDTTPAKFNIPVPYVENFKRSAVEVLKFKPATDNVISTVFDFVNTDKDDFEKDEYITFNGDMALKNVYERKMTEQPPNAVTNGKLYTIDMDVDEFRKINRITAR